MVLEWADPGEKGTARSLSIQLNLDLETDMAPSEPRSVSSPVPTSFNMVGSQKQELNRQNDVADESSRPSLMDEDLALLRSQMQKHVDRIRNLERALDQSLILVAELREQLVDQQFLEKQLAATEEIANIQQQAITKLKQQLADQQSPPSNLTGHPSATAGADSAESAFPACTIGWQDAASQKLVDLTQQLETRQHVIEQLETELDRAHLELQEQQLLIDSLQRSTGMQTVTHNSSLDQELFTAHCKIQELEIQVSKQITTQAILQHTCHELEQARDRYHARAQELELQTADMQEQILKQAQQASEYETAIQHWKDRYGKSQDYLHRMHDLIGQLDSPSATELLELVSTVHGILTAPEPENATLTTNRPPKMDIPDFLARHQRYRVRS